jgi:copper resistance protein B
LAFHFIVTSDQKRQSEYFTISVKIGLGQARAALRLRYEVSRQFAPYVGVQRTGHYGGTAALLGERANTQWLAGVKAWF